MKKLKDRTIIAKFLHWVMDLIEECVQDRKDQEWSDIPKMQFWLLEFPLTCISTLLLALDFQIEKLGL
jgi:hypothetical protein